MLNKNIIKKLVIKLIIVSIFILFGSLIINKNSKYKDYVFNNIYNNYLSLAKIKSLYNKYLGEIPFQNIIKEEEVFNEKIKYKELNAFNNGIKLTLDDNYSIPIIKRGIVIFIGNKEELNNTVIIEDENGIDYIYGNLSKVNVHIYDYVKENDFLGEASNNELYLLFQKGDEYLDYKEFIH